MTRHRIFFWGSKPLGYECFRYLLDFVKANRPDVQIAGVGISERDIKKTRRNYSEIGRLAEEHVIPVFTESDRAPRLGDLGISVGYPHKIPTEVLDGFPLGTINVHLGPLPHYRGSKTVIHAILNSEQRFGASLHYLDSGLDTGDVIENEWIKLSPDDTTVGVTKALEQVSLDMFKTHLPTMLSFERLSATPQSVLATQLGITPKFYTRRSIQSLYQISLQWPTEKIHRYVRALSTGGQHPYFVHDEQKIYMTLEATCPGIKDMEGRS